MFPLCCVCVSVWHSSVLKEFFTCLRAPFSNTYCYCVNIFVFLSNTLTEQPSTYTHVWAHTHTRNMKYAECVNMKWGRRESKQKVEKKITGTSMKGSKIKSSIHIFIVDWKFELFFFVECNFYLLKKVERKCCYFLWWSVVLSFYLKSNLTIFLET